LAWVHDFLPRFHFYKAIVKMICDYMYT
jgi:hypothetical protein